MTITFPLSNWLPDQALLDGTGTIEALNVVPRARGYGSFSSFAALTSALPNRIQGATFFHQSTNVLGFIVGDATKLYEEAAGGTWSDVSGPSAPFNCPSTGHWSFVQFGPNLLAFNGVDPTQILNVDIGGTFAPLAGAPVAFYACVVGDFVMTGNQGVAGGPNKLQWSAINDCTSWTASQQTQADSQLLPDSGPINALFGYNYSAIILQENAVRIGTYEGPALIFRFAKIAEGLGCSIPGSAALYRDWCFFYSYNGLYMLQAASQLTPIGEQRVNAWLKANINMNYAYRCVAAIDPANSLYVFGFPDQTSSGSINHFLLYNYLLDQFAHTQAGNFDWLFSGLIPSIPGKPFLGAIDPTHTMGYFNGAPLAATVTAGELNLVNGKKAFVRGARPLIEGASPPAISVALGTRDLQTNAISYASPVPMDQFGYCRFRSKGRYHSAQINLAAGGTWDYILGLTDPLFVPFGTR